MRKRFFQWVARWLTRYPWWVLGVAAALTAVSGWVAATRLVTDANQDHLVSEELDYHRRYMDYLRAFGDQEYLFVVVEANGRPEQARAAIDALAARLGALPSLAELFGKMDLATMGRSSLLFLPTPQLEGLVAALQQPGLAPRDLADVRQLADLFGLINRQLGGPLTLFDRAALEYGFRVLGAFVDTMVTAIDHDLSTQDGAVASPLASLLSPANGQGIALDTHGYLSAGDRLFFLLVMPAKDYQSLAVIERPLREIRAAIAAVRLEFPELRMGLTGRPALAADEMTITNRDMTRATLVALLAVGLIFALFLRRRLAALFAVAALSCGMSWAFGFATLVIGSLNLLSVVFSVILVGAGIEFGLHIVARYDEERRHGRLPAEAVEQLLTRTAYGNLTACATTAAAFFAALLTDFSALRELGIIAGTGIIFCLLGHLTVLPALLLVTDRRLYRRISTDTVLPAVARWCVRPIVTCVQRPRWIIGGATLLTLAVIPALQRVHFNHNLLHLQAAGLESVDYEHVITRETDASTWQAVILRRSAEDVAALLATIRGRQAAGELTTFGQIESIHDVVPAEQERKIALLRPVAASADDIERSTTIESFRAPQLLTALSEFSMRLAPLAEAALRQGEGAAVGELEQLRERVDRVRAALRTGDPAFLARLTTLDANFARDWQGVLGALLDGLDPEPVTIASLPSMFQRRFLGQDGQYAVYVTPKQDIWDPAAMHRFVAELRSVDPHVTGVPIEVYESSLLLEESFLLVALMAMGAILVMVVIDFRRLGAASLAALPLMLGLWWLLGAMGWSGLPFNLANFFAIPILIGVGIDNGVQLIHRVRQDGGFTPATMTSSTGIGILLTSFTTLASFATLCFAAHRGIRSLGLVMTVGSLCCMFAVLLVLPAILQWRTTRYGAQASSIGAQVHGHRIRHA